MSSQSARLQAHRGFTIVELVVAIVLIAILSAVALPRFVDTKDEARTNAARTSMAGFQEAVNLVHGRWLAEGATATSMTLGPNVVQLTNEGWPKSQISNTPDCIDVWNGVFNAAEDIVPFVANTPQDAWSALGFAAGCLYVYQHGEAFTAGNPLPFFVYLPDTTGVRILPFNM